MANDTISDSELRNGNKTPAKENVEKNAKKRWKYDDQRNLDDSSNSVDCESDELEREKQKNRDLQFMIGRLQGQLSDLTKQIEQLTNVITEMQNEKKQLIDLFQKKSPSKSDKRSKKNHSKKHSVA